MKFDRHKKCVFYEGDHVDPVIVIGDLGVIGSLGHVVRVRGAGAEFVVRAENLRDLTELELREGRPVSPPELFKRKQQGQLDQEILKALSGLGGTATVRQVADALKWSPVKVSTVSRRMENQNLLSRSWGEAESGRPYMVLSNVSAPEPE